MASFQFSSGGGYNSNKHHDPWIFPPNFGLTFSEGLTYQNTNFSHPNLDFHVRCLEKVPKIFSQMVVWWWFTLAKSVKNHQLNKSKDIISQPPTCIQYHKGCKWWWHDHNNDHDANVGKYVHPSTPISWRVGGTLANRMPTENALPSGVIQYVTKRYRLVGGHLTLERVHLTIQKGQNHVCCETFLEKNTPTQITYVFVRKTSVTLQHNRQHKCPKCWFFWQMERRNSIC